MKKVVAVTACPTGIAHTYMAAENLQMAAKEMGVDIKVETQGSIGAENQLTEEDIKAADAVIIAAATKVDKSRFAGKPVLEVPVEDAIKDAKGLIEKVLKMEKPKDYVEKVEEIHKERSAKRTGAYKHLMTGVSYMIPFVVAGGILIALSFFWGYKAFEVEGTLPWALMKIGGGSAFALMVPILSGYIAFSIADRPGLVPGMVGGMLAVSTGAGFLGGIISGFLAGYTIVYLKRLIKLPKTLEGLMPILILPVLSTLIVGLLMIYVIGSPMKAIMTSLTAWLTGMSSTNAVIFGAILGLMMAFDMGGPVNKTAYTFATGLLASNVFAPMAAVMAAGMTPPLGLALATVLFKNRFTKEEIEAGKAAWVLGASFITEGAIPFAAADPFRVIPSIMVGSAVTAALSMLFHIELRAPHGGIFVIPIAVSNPLLYIGVIAVGTVVTALMIAVLKKKVE
ncbi:PTS system D-fructose-specific IIB component (F1P-forming), Frc family /PTS system D-fructose-specific IIC component (F1P-forming), Frc family [Thermoanaerobacter uzonensis DSM 18761]|uniref:PTS system D-fructose-specific IIB component (F1P-forming), Frc family /PTS system D-fructose-specific IIC component (F1P-forming), Frc family n=1 Tax=Thermoanaerobacter uzonensis DSM 18761 TaxID=1123369 RepID=A0A1M4XA55_9THEO|nr:fructose-specific PTS transporter subunit EIIC [Thermoanaerobacter uzonensis]SHE90388.1 PTS system D-fructose-specific IIB component (F1P-forming), Frc family /PTS system D-fructose-specific IIC component (F1P-forming), Frc family [Thermoanaerobacter uzonensis DSM 18761]